LPPPLPPPAAAAAAAEVPSGRWLRLVVSTGPAAGHSFASGSIETGQQVSGG
jgi:hypothetical protein